jgi:hypothetical protein
MPLGHWNQEWLNQNSQRKYPLADDASGEGDSGFVIPNDFIVELDLSVHAGLDVVPGRFFIYKIGAYSTGYSVVVGYQPVSGDPVNVATALIARQLHTRNRVYNLGGIEPFDDAVGKLVIGRLDAIDEQPPGFHTFSFENSRLDPDAIRPIIRGVSSVVVVNNGQRSRPIYGDVELVAGSNFLIETTATAGGATITFNAIKGEGTVDDCECVAEDDPPIKTINGIAPTPEGNFFIVGDNCIDTDEITNGLRVSDTCAKPCCSCQELEEITRALEELKKQANSVERFADKLQNAVDTMSSVVLASKLGGGCS